MYAEKRPDADNNVMLAVRRLRVLFPRFNRQWESWGSAERSDYQTLLVPLMELPVVMVRNGLETIRKKFTTQEPPHVDEIIKILSSGAPTETRNYRANNSLESEYAAALAKHDWKEMQRLRTLLARDRLTQLSPEALLKPTGVIFGYE